MNKLGETKQPIYDLKLFGTLLRHYREEAGFKKPEDFADAIYELTDYEVSKETLYRIEKGISEPKMSLYFAMGLTLFGEMELQKITDICNPKRWKNIMEAERESRYQSEIDRLESNGF